MSNGSLEKKAREFLGDSYWDGDVMEAVVKYMADFARSLEPG